MENPEDEASLGEVDVELEAPKGHLREEVVKYPVLPIRMWSLAKNWSREKCLFGSSSAAPTPQAVPSLVSPHFPAQGTKRGSESCPSPQNPSSPRLAGPVPSLF